MPVSKTVNRNLLTVKSKSPGFTLIELLIVIVIIGILATIAIATLNTGLKKGRDAKRIADMKAFKQTMEMAKSDCVGQSTYPAYNLYNTGSGPARFNAMLIGLNNAGYKLAVKDPLTPSQYGYMSNTLGTEPIACPGSYGSPPTIQSRTHWFASAPLELNNSATLTAWKQCENIDSSSWGGYSYTANIYIVCSET